MFSARLLVLAALATSLVNAAAPPTLVNKGIPANDSPDFSDTKTDADTIADTVKVVDQKSGPGPNDPPDQPPANTTVTAVDGQLVDNVPVNSTTTRRKREIPGRFARATKRHTEYQQVFAGTGTGPNDRDGSIQGTAYLTFTLVSNDTYNVDDCLTFCDQVQGCVFANLYYEYNNPGLQQEKSNLKCAVYGDIHTAVEKTNRGGQNLGLGDDHLTFIQQSSGWGKDSLVDPETPEGYELVFGPADGANNAPGYMGFAFLDQYDVSACAALCDKRGADGVGGVCQFFNIWRAVVNGVPTTYSCSMYFLVSDASTAVNFGQGDLKVTFSRGYKRSNLVIDGGFEEFTCDDGSDFCFAESYANWIGTSPAGGHWDALIFHFTDYAFLGTGVGTLGSGDGSDALSGTLKPAKPLATTAGAKYTLQFFHASSFSGDLEADAFVDIIWNGQTISTIRPGNSPYKPFQFDVTAKGNDVLEFHGGTFPSYDFIDNVGLFITF